MFIVLILGVGLSFLLWEFYYKRNWDKDVKVQLSFSADSIYVGEHVKLIEVIENRKKMPLPVLEVGFHTKRDLLFQNTVNTYISDNTYKRDIFACLGKQKITRQIDVRGNKRGFYQIDAVDLTSYSLLHDRRFSKSMDCNVNLYVYPARVKVDDLVVVCERMLGDIQCSKRIFEDPFAFRAIREYQIDDPMKTINWNASARTGKLMVNTFDSVLTNRAFIFLDLEDSSILKHDNLIEYSISLTATLAWKLLTKNMEIGIASNCDINMETAAGKKHMANLEKKLALYKEADSKDNTTITEVICGYTEQFDEDEDSIFIFISKNYTEELVATINTFLGKKRKGILIIPYTIGEAINEIKTNNLNLKIITREVPR